MTKSFMKQESRDRLIVIVGAIGGFIALIARTPGLQDVIVFSGIAVCAVILVEIKGKLEAIRFMMAHRLEHELGLND